MQYLWKITDGRTVREARRGVLALALLFVIFIILTPTPFVAGDTTQDEQLDRAIQAKRARQAARIYSTLKFHTRNLTESTVRELAATILSECEKYSLDPVLVLGVISVESEFHHKAVSSTGARGLMQILPSTATALAREAGLEEWQGAKSLYDPVINAKLGILYLSQLKERFNDTKIALAAYRWGPTSVQEKMQNRQEVPFKYSHKVLALARLYHERPPKILTDRPSLPGQENSRGQLT